MKNIKYICIVLILVLGLTGCGGPKPDAVVESFLEAFHAVDFTTVEQYVIDENGEPMSFKKEDMPDMFNGVCNAIAYEDITIVSSEKDSAKVTARVTTIDGAMIYNQFLKEAMEIGITYAFMGISDAEFDAMMERLLNSLFNAADAPKVTNTVTFNLTKIDGNWKVIFDEELLDGLSGGMASSFAGEDIDFTEEIALSYMQEYWYVSGGWFQEDCYWYSEKVSDTEYTFEVRYRYANTTSDLAGYFTVCADGSIYDMLTGELLYIAD